MNKISPFYRRSEFDVTNQIQVTEPASVASHVIRLYTETYGSSGSTRVLARAFNDFARLFRGKYPGYRACDTLYHDMQHTLDVTLTMARLINGHEQQHPQNTLGQARFTLGIIIALFHDSGYIRKNNDHNAMNGAVYTLTHVTRSGEFLKEYLLRIGLGKFIDRAATLVHFTGYELNPDELTINDPKDKILGHLLGTSDLISQMSDRCYLEKCRDRLYQEFVTCGLAGQQSSSSQGNNLFVSAQDLLSKTPWFYRNCVMKRLDRSFKRAFNYAGVHFDGTNPYIECIDRNIQHLEVLNEHNDYSGLNRRLPHVTESTLYPTLRQAIG
jgi:hypothetical protein